jgi:elongation factor Ts
MSFTSADIKALREQTGVGMMDCKKALEATNGNIEAAIKHLREKGMMQAAKKGGRIAAEGIVDSYIHMGGKIGVLLEVNCETDFVARSDAFKELVHNIAMQIAAAKPEFVSKEDVDNSKIENERKILTLQAKNEPKPKPDNVIEKMVEGRISKFYKDICLLEQDYVKDTSKTILQLINESVLKIGEKISVRRFARYEMGEGLKKKEENFAAEVMEQVTKMEKSKKAK